jgi:hypothetical protein
MKQPRQRRRCPKLQPMKARLTMQFPPAPNRNLQKRKKRTKRTKKKRFAASRLIISAATMNPTKWILARCRQLLSMTKPNLKNRFVGAVLLSRD